MTRILLGTMALALFSCGEDQETEANTPKPPERSVRTNRRSEWIPRSAEPRAKPPREMPAAPPEVAVQPLAKEQPAPAESSAEAEARRAEERERRVVGMLENIATRMQENDADGDGLLSKAELQGPMASRFSDLDANGDGFLDEAEQQAMLEKIASRMNEQSSRWGSEAGRRGPGGRGPGGRGPGGGKRRRN